MTPASPPNDPRPTPRPRCSTTRRGGRLPGATIVGGVAGGDLAYDGPFWKTRSPLEVVDRVDVPAFVVGGHHDLFQRGEPLVYERLKRNVPARLLMGPWTHVEGSSGAGLPRDGVPSLSEIELRWFDHWLYGLDTDIDRIPKVTQYVYGKERYKVAGRLAATRG